MRRLKRIAVAAATLLAAAVPGAGEEAPTSPPLIIAEIRTLFSLQDAAANGSSEAVELQRQLLSQIKQRQPQDIKDLQPNAATAAMIAGYVLSGGQPGLAEQFATAEGLGGHSRKLLLGSAHYMRGERDAAIEQLKTIEPVLLPMRIGGRVALVKAMLTVADASERERLLAIAIALMPGTLVEESALRRSATSQAELGNAGLFWNRTERYLRRFPHSLYAPEFMAQAVSRVVGFEAAGKPAGLPRFDLALAMLSLSQRRTIYLQLAREAAAVNLGPLTQFAAFRLRRLATEGSVEMLQAHLYGSLHDVTGPHYEEIVRRLESVDGSRLADNDRRLLQAALSIARQIRAPGGMAEDVTDEIGNTALQTPELSALIARAKSAIASAGKALEQGSQ